ncbi:MAG: Stf0 family sulfotransferase, partial [Parasphingopyxis sp.]
NEVVQRILHERAGAVFASKCTRDSLITAAFLGILDQFLDHITFLIIDRRDKVAQAVSFHKARVGGRFHSSQAEQRPVSPNDFDFDEIYRFYRRFHDISEKFDSLGDAFGRPLQRFWYEDFTEDPLAFIEAVTCALGFEVTQDFRAEAQVKKLGDAINDEWAERFRAMLADRERPALA